MEHLALSIVKQHFTKKYYFYDCRTNDNSNRLVFAHQDEEGNIKL